MTLDRRNMDNADRRRLGLEPENRVLQCRSPCCNRRRRSICPKCWKGRKDGNCKLGWILSSGQHVIWNASFFCTFVRFIFQKLTKKTNSPSETQRNLGFNEFFQKLKPELKHWYSEIVCVSIALHLRLSPNGNNYVVVPEIYCRIQREVIY